MSTGPICGLWVDPKTSRVHLARADGDRRLEEVHDFAPFAWATNIPPAGEYEATDLVGSGPFAYRLRFPTVVALRDCLDDPERGAHLDHVRPYESMWLLDRQERMFAGMNFGDLKRVQLDIETACAREGGFSDPKQKEDRVLAIGLWPSNAAAPVMLTLEENSDEAEQALLESFNAWLATYDPDLIEGHNCFNFDLDYLAKRMRRFKVKVAWGRFGQVAKFRSSRLRVAERWIDFQRCDIPGRAVFDTFLAVQLYDLATRELSGYGLKEVAVHLGITVEDDARTYLAGNQIANAFATDREAFLAYLRDDLRETRGIADFLLPTYIAQAQNFPLPLPEIFLRGTGVKVDRVLMEKYHAADHALPAAGEVGSFEGGFTKSYGEGVFRNVLHFDVASLYPSLLLHLGRNPAGDELGIFIPLLEELRAYRLEYKQKAREATDPSLKLEYTARQNSFKILINSFYGYLGFPGARFADGELAAEVTRTGRELLQALIARFEELGCHVLEADTDGVYVTGAAYQESPDKLAAEVSTVLPEGIVLEHDGTYPAMLVYKAKNYALFDGEKVIIRGSALRSRGLEPFLKELTQALLHYRLGASAEHPQVLYDQLHAAIEARELPVTRLAKAEALSQSPAAYARKIAAGGKPRRAALEVAQTLEPTPRMGDRVAYYIRPREKGQTSEWQRARALAHFDADAAPYDPKYYLKKLADWRKRYAGVWPPEAVQG